MIGGPVPQRVGRPVLRTLILVGVPLALVAAVVLAVVPGPSPPSLFSQVVVVHDSILPARLDPTDPRETPVPRLQASLESVLDARRIESWLYSYGRERVTVHRIHDRLEPPRNAQQLAFDGAKVSLFELRDLSFLVWTEDGERTLAVVGSCPVHDLKEVVSWVLEHGTGAPVTTSDEPL